MGGFEEWLDMQIMFGDIFEKCKTKEELDRIHYDLEWAMDDCYGDRLEEIDPLKTTPMEAINLLYELKELSKK